MSQQKEILSIIKAGVMLAIGCTEPGAVALAAAFASEALGGAQPEYITVSVDGNVYKNGLAVGVPGTGQAGLPIAAALGGLIGKPTLQLAILSEITPEILTDARNMVQQGRVTITLNDSQGLYIEATASAGANQAKAIIADSHVNLVLLQVNGAELFRQESGGQGKPKAEPGSQESTLMGLIQAVEAAAADELAFLEDCASINKAAAMTGLQGRLGMAVGANFQDLIQEQILADDLVSHAKILTAAAADARMSGENIPVMSVAGSGNHGLTAILPVIAVAERMNIPREQVLRALAVSIVTTLYIKRYTGGLSALCGCAVAAATGASAAIVWMLGGKTEHINGAVKNMIANLTGMICDGGKVGCALKLATAAGAAVETALLTMKNVVVPCSNGIIFPSTESTIRNLGMVSNPGMIHTDRIILDIMLEKGNVSTTGQM